jgi:hypothetical protein
MTMTARTAGVVAAACAAAAMIMFAACSVPSGAQPVLSSADLAATWASPDGGSITFASDNRFKASGLRFDKFWAGCAGRGKISGPGTWQFLSAQGDSGMYSKGSLIGLYFAAVAGGSSSLCLGGITLTSWNVDSAPGLCLQMDPDTPCAGYIFKKH